MSTKDRKRKCCDAREAGELKNSSHSGIFETSVEPLTPREHSYKESVVRNQSTVLKQSVDRLNTNPKLL